MFSPVILERETTHPSTHYSNLGGWQSTWDFAEWGGSAASELLRAVEAIATRLTADREGRPVRPAWKINAWANVNRKGHGNEFHTHPGSFWSGTYYVDDGGISREPNFGGEFEFQDPRGIAPAMYAPNLCIAVPGGEAMGVSETLRPRAGLIVLFPAWLNHAVRPYNGAGQRKRLVAQTTHARCNLEPHNRDPLIQNILRTCIPTGGVSRISRLCFTLSSVSISRGAARCGRTTGNHLEYLDRAGAQVRLAGPLVGEDGETPVGSMIVYEGATLEEAEVFAIGDPYRTAKLFDAVVIKPWALRRNNLGS